MGKADRKEVRKLLLKATRPLAKNGIDCRPEFILGGGTKVGISRVAWSLGEAEEIPVHGWLPPKRDAAPGVHAHFHKPSNRFTVEQPLAMWQYLEHRNLLRPNCLAVVATSGGAISNSELALAAACGVPIALLPFGDPAETEGAVSLFDPSKRQLEIPADPMVLRAFLLRSWGLMKSPPPLESGLVDPDLIRIAILSADPKDSKQAARGWDEESPERVWEQKDANLKKSSLDQKANYVHYVKEAGVRVRGNRLTPHAIDEFEYSLKKNPDLRDRLAELEHGRWVVERLELGKVRGPRPFRGDPPDHSTIGTRIRNEVKYLYRNLTTSGAASAEPAKPDSKDPTHSDLVAWTDLPTDVQDQDYEAIDKIPKLSRVLASSATTQSEA